MQLMRPPNRCTLRGGERDPLTEGLRVRWHSGLGWRAGLTLPGLLLMLLNTHPGTEICPDPSPPKYDCGPRLLLLAKGGWPSWELSSRFWKAKAQSQPPLLPVLMSSLVGLVALLVLVHWRWLSG